jgi:protein-S-isoprenylcysteine O-methyltransferase Ste14
MTQSSLDGAKIHFPPPLIYLLAFLIGIAAERVWDLPNLGLAPPVRLFLGAASVIAGLIVSVASVRLFNRHHTAIIPYKPATALVTTGIYRWSRNPMYLALAMLYVGAGVLLNSLSALILLPAVLAIIQSQVIAREEAYLQRAFGPEYTAYRQRVRMWI